MKKYCLSIAIALWSLSLFGEGAFDSEETRARYEANITKRFSDALKPVLADENYSINTSVSIIEREVRTYAPSKRPGFNDETTVDLSQKVKGAEQDLLVQKEPRLKAITLTLFLEKELDQELKNVAIQTIKTKMKHNFDDKGTLKVENFDLASHHKAENSRYYLDTLKNNFMNILYLLAGLLALIILLWFIRSMIKETRKKDIDFKSNELDDEEEENKEEGEEEKTKEEQEETLEQKAAKLGRLTLLRTLREDVLYHYEHDTGTLKKFVKILQQRDIDILSCALEGSLFMNDILKFSSTIHGENLNESSFKEKEIQDLIENLKDYKRLNHIPLKEPFGFIDRMDIELIEESIKDGKDIALLLNFLSEHKIPELLEHLNTDMKAKVLALLDTEGFAKGQKSTLAKLDSQLRKDYEENDSSEVVYNKRSQVNSIDKLLNYDSTVDQTVKSAHEDHGLELTDKYQVYTITFEELIAASDLSPVVAIVKDFDDNENVIAILSYFNEKQQNEILSTFNPTRKTILGSLAHTVDVTEEKKEAVKQAFMKAFRASKRK